MGMIRRFAQRLRYKRLHRLDVAVSHAVLGSDYGGWPVILDRLSASDIAYSFGVGSDISFDLALVEQTGCTVHAFDPTPRARDWIAHQHVPAKFHFHALGLADSDGELSFFAPAADHHDSFSLQPDPKASGTTASCPVRRLSSLLADLGHALPALLKMDIEGFEYAVIEDLCTGNLRPAQLLVEFHHGMYGFDTDVTLAAVARLREIGYRIFHISPTAHEYGFVHMVEG